MTVTFDDTTVQFAIAAADPTAPLELYIGAPRSTSPGRGTTLDGRVLGFRATQAVRIDPDGTACIWESLPKVGVSEPFVECTPLDGITIPLATLGGMQQGDRLLVRLAAASSFTPTDAPGGAVAPDVGGVEPILELTDPEGDDHGPGSTTYPTDEVFTPGVFDLTGFEWGVAGEELVLTFDMAAPVRNPWGSPTGLSLQTFDVYIDADPGAGTGATELHAGRGASLAGDDAWDAAVVIEGWYSKVLQASGDDVVEQSPTIALTVLAEEGRVIARVPMSALGLTTDPSTWRVGVAVLSQDGYPSAGVDRVRDVDDTAAQWRLGGGAPTRIIDSLEPDAGVQEELLGGEPPVLALH